LLIPVTTAHLAKKKILFFFDGLAINCSAGALDHRAYEQEQPETNGRLLSLVKL
jgi:hypothetical protein